MVRTRVDARGVRGVVGQRIIDRGDDLIRIVTAQFVPARHVSGMFFIECRLILAVYAPKASPASLSHRRNRGAQLRKVLEVHGGEQFGSPHAVGRQLLGLAALKRVIEEHHDAGGDFETCHHGVDFRRRRFPRHRSRPRRL